MPAAVCAENLARIDCKSALELIQDLRNQYQFDRHHGNIAKRIAAANPAEAERVWKMSRAQRPHGTKQALPICFAMAPVDLPRARSIADAIADPPLKAYAVGLMAQALADSDRPKATAMIHEAYSYLSELVDRNVPRGYSVNSAIGVAVALLPMVEHVDPALLDECMWRAISLRPNHTFGNPSYALGPGEGRRLRLSDPVLAAFIAGYDPSTARLLLTPPGDDLLSVEPAEYPWYFFTTAAVLDAEATLAVIQKLPEDDEAAKKAKSQAFLEFTSQLRLDSKQRWQYLVEKQLYLWYPGQDFE